MVTKQSKLFSRARKEAPADAEVASHKLLTRAGYIDQLGSGLFSLLPLGWLASKKVEDIIRDEMKKLGAQEILMPALQPASLWQESGRLDKMDPPLFRLADRHNKELVLASTHEESVTDLARGIIESYKDLPAAVFQIQTKFRNETRATGGLLRVREFQMKDLYSFHRSEADLASFYGQVQQAYKNIFERCDLTVYVAAASSGTIGGAVSHEFQVAAASGEDRVLVCPKCGYAANSEVGSELNNVCPECGSALEIKNCIESGHTFQLGTKYSEAMRAYYTEEKGESRPLVMGCYGIGVGRLLATVAETHHDERGLKWPNTISPLAAHILPLQGSAQKDAEDFVAEHLAGLDVLFDDRDISAGQKLAESDLIGITHKIIISEKTKAQHKVEFINRATGTHDMLEPEAAAKILTRPYASA